MINPVLCVTREAIYEQIGLVLEPPTNLVVSLELMDIDQSNFHFLNRTIADTKNPKHLNIAKQLPQVLPYVLVTFEDEVLTYSRAKGAEDRLHGSLSCGFGGHVDLSDINPNMFNLSPSIMRELQEELRLDISKPFTFLETGLALIDNTNEVGQVHLGYVYSVELSSKEMVNPDPSEIHLAEWKTIEELHQDKDRYENWSQSLINELQGII